MLMDKEKNALKFSLQGKRSRSFGNLSVRGKALESRNILDNLGRKYRVCRARTFKKIK